MRQSIITFATRTARLSRRLMIGITLLVGIFGTGLLPAQAAPRMPAAVSPSISHEAAPIVRAGTKLLARAAAASGTVYIEVTQLVHNVTFNGDTGMMIHMYVEFTNLKGKAMRVAAFFYYSADDTIVAADPVNSPDSYITSDGSLTSQLVVTPPYADSVYKDFKLFLPYAALPAVSGSVDVYILPSVGLDGKAFSVFGDRSYFTITG